MTRNGGGWVVDTLETLYVDAGTTGGEFGARALRAMAPGLDLGIGLGFSLVDMTERRWRFFQAFTPQGELVDLSAHPPGLGFSEAQTEKLFPLLYNSTAPVSLLSNLLGVERLTDEPAMHAVMSAFPGVGDAIGMPSIPQPGLGLCAFAGVPTGTQLTRPRLRALTRLAFHLETSVRQRLSGLPPVGVVSLSGRVDFEGRLQDTTRASISQQVRVIERLRLRGHRADDDVALETWRALIAGYLSLFEHVDSDGKRQYYLYENPPRAVPALALTRTESAVVGQLSRGVMNKEVGYALGLSESQVSRTLKSAAEKLGLSTGKETVRVAALLHRVPIPTATATPLTPAEVELVSLLGEGLSDQEIAARRGTSTRTVANQVAKIFQKTGAHTRRAFLGLSPAHP
jgi:DNA-binding NarL/FixJ family response regulator